MIALLVKARKLRERIREAYWYRVALGLMVKQDLSAGGDLDEVTDEQYAWYLRFRIEKRLKLEPHQTRWLHDYTSNQISGGTVRPKDRVVLVPGVERPDLPAAFALGAEMDYRVVDGKQTHWIDHSPVASCSKRGAHDVSDCGIDWGAGKAKP